MILGGLLYLVQDRIAPASNRKAQTIKDQIQGRAPRTHGLSAAGSWRFGSEGNSLYHYVLHDAGKDEYQGLSVFTLDRSVPRIVEHRFSGLARFVDGAWQLDDGWHRSFSPPDGQANRTSAADIESSLTRHDEPYDMALDIPSNLVRGEAPDRPPPRRAPGPAEPAGAETTDPYAEQQRLRHHDPPRGLPPQIRTVPGPAGDGAARTPLRLQGRPARLAVR